MFGKSPNVSAKTSAFIRGKRLKCDENAVFSSKTMYKKNSFAQLCNPYISFREQNHFRFLILEQH